MMTPSYTLPPTVNKSTALDCLAQVQTLLAQSSAELAIDGAQVQQIDCAGIALLLELKLIAQTKRQLKLINLSPSISNLCSLYQIKL